MLKTANRLLVWLSAPALWLATSQAFAEESGRSAINMPQGVTATSADVYSLHMLIFWICVVIGIIVFGVMFYSMIVHRKSNGAKASNFHHSTSLEIVWTVIPFLILSSGRKNWRCS